MIATVFVVMNVLALSIILTVLWECRKLRKHAERGPF